MIRIIEEMKSILDGCYNLAVFAKRKVHKKIEFLGPVKRRVSIHMLRWWAAF